jgi:hypothetical protein
MELDSLDWFATKGAGPLARVRSLQRGEAFVPALPICGLVSSPKAHVGNGMTSPPRIPKGSKEGGGLTTKPKRDSSGKFLPKWAGELRKRVDDLDEWANDAVKAAQIQNRAILDLRERLGTSTPLIIWNIAVLVGLVYLGVAHFAPGSVP